MISGPFARAMLAAFFFFGSLNGFVLLPLYIHQPRRHRGGDRRRAGDCTARRASLSAAGRRLGRPAGPPTVHAGRRRASSLVASAAFIVSSSIPVLAVLRALHGVAFSAFFVANYLHVVDLVPPERRGWALGIFGVSGLISTSLAPLLGEILVRHCGLRGAVLVLDGARRRRVGTWPSAAATTRPPTPGAGPGPPTCSARACARSGACTWGSVFFFGLGTGTMFTFLPTFARAARRARPRPLLHRLRGRGDARAADRRSRSSTCAGRARVIVPVDVRAGRRRAASWRSSRRRCSPTAGARAAVPVPRRASRGRRPRLPLSRAVRARSWT